MIITINRVIQKQFDLARKQPNILVKKGGAVMRISSIQFDETKAMLSVQETARSLSLSEYTIYKLIHDQELPALQFGRRFKIKAEDIMDHVDKQKVNCMRSGG